MPSGVILKRVKTWFMCGLPCGNRCAAAGFAGAAASPIAAAESADGRIGPFGVPQPRVTFAPAPAGPGDVANVFPLFGDLWCRPAVAS